jgi:hypothetical protein
MGSNLILDQMVVAIKIELNDMRFGEEPYTNQSFTKEAFKKMTNISKFFLNYLKIQEFLGKTIEKTSWPHIIHK